MKREITKYKKSDSDSPNNEEKASKQEKYLKEWRHTISQKVDKQEEQIQFNKKQIKYVIDKCKQLEIKDRKLENEYFVDRFDTLQQSIEDTQKLIGKNPSKGNRKLSYPSKDMNFDDNVDSDYIHFSGEGGMGQSKYLEYDFGNEDIGCEII